MTQLKRIETKDAPKAVGPYSQAVTDGTYLYVSGQLAIDPATSKMMTGDVQLQTQLVFKNLEAILKAGGSSLDDVIRTDVFLKDLNDFKKMNEEYGKHFKEGSYPARQTIGCDLFMGALVEISCIALVKKS
jgi:2-iminobutanoate/2-iminopropanoate deaminase